MNETYKVAFNRIQDRDDVLRECDGLEIHGKKDRFMIFSTVAVIYIANHRNSTTV